MKLIVGLGNPEEKYKLTRHNVGFMVVNALSERLENNDWVKKEKFSSEIIKTPDFILAKPTTFMNNSGKAVSNLFNHYKIKPSDLWIIHDDLDIVLGEYKIQKGKGPRLHKGVLSIERVLSKKDFWRVRMGVENREGDKDMPGEKYVLQHFSDTEFDMLKPAIHGVVEELFTKITSI